METEPSGYCCSKNKIEDPNHRLVSFGGLIWIRTRLKN